MRPVGHGNGYRRIYQLFRQSCRRPATNNIRTRELIRSVEWPLSIPQTRLERKPMYNGIHHAVVATSPNEVAPHHTWWQLRTLIAILFQLVPSILTMYLFSPLYITLLFGEGREKDMDREQEDEGTTGRRRTPRYLIIIGRKRERPLPKVKL